jgi:hypothetical protein
MSMLTPGARKQKTQFVYYYIPINASYPGLQVIDRALYQTLVEKDSTTDSFQSTKHVKSP